MTELYVSLAAVGGLLLLLGVLWAALLDLEEVAMADPVSTLSGWC